MRRGPYRYGVKVQNTATVIAEWEGNGYGEVAAVVLHNLNVGDALVSVYILPPGIVAVADEYIICPKLVSVPQGMSLDLEIAYPYPIGKGETVVAVADSSNYVTASAITREWYDPIRAAAGGLVGVARGYASAVPAGPHRVTPASPFRP